MMNRIALFQIKANKWKERKKERQINPPLISIPPNKIPASFACI
jgi:hypothetical protein